MAKQVTALVAGGDPKILKNVDTVLDVRKKLELDKSYTATVNGEPADMDDELEDYATVTFAAAVRGGHR